MTSISLQEESNLLFRAYQEGNTAALSELYRRWHEFVTWSVKESNSFSQDDIEDISSNVWVLVQEHAHKWDIERSGWYLFLKYSIRSTISTEKIRRKRRHQILRDNGFVEFKEKPIKFFLDGDSRDVNFGLLDETLSHFPHFASQPVDPEPSALETLIESERKEILEKAIQVCAFPPITEKILRLRFKGMTLQRIQKTLGLKHPSCVRLHLQRAFEDLKAVIDPVTWEVATVAPKVRRSREKAEHLQRAGAALKRCMEQKALTPIEVSRAAKIKFRDLMSILKGKSKPEAPRLYRLASVFGDLIYDIYMPTLKNADWREQGQSLWRKRVGCGLSLRKVSQITAIDYSLLTQYEEGKLKITPEAETLLVTLFAKCRR